MVRAVSRGPRLLAITLVWLGVLTCGCRENRSAQRIANRGPVGKTNPQATKRRLADSAKHSAQVPAGASNERSYLQRVLRSDPGNQKALLRLSVLLMRAQRLPEAEAALLQVVHDQNDSFQAQQGLAELYSRIGFIDLEMRALQRQIKIEPRALGAYLRYSAILLELRRFPEAKAVLDQARRFSSENPDLYLAEANYHFALTRNPEAIRAARQATVRFPLDSHSYQVLSRFYFAEKDYDNALTAIREASRLQPSAPDYHRQRAEILIARGGNDDLEEAMGILRGLLTDNPDDLTVRYWLGIDYARLKRPQEAIRELEQVARVTLRQEAVAFELGTLLSKYGDKKRGKQLLDEFRAMENLSGRLRRIRFQLWSKRDDPKVHFDAARIYVAIGNVPSAIAELKRVLELDPQNRQASRRLQELYALTGRGAESIAGGNVTGP